MEVLLSSLVKPMDTSYILMALPTVIFDIDLSVRNDLYQIQVVDQDNNRSQHSPIQMTETVSGL